MAGTSGGAGGTSFSCQAKEVDGAVRLVLSGELDLSSVPIFRANVSEAVGIGGGIIFDFTNLRYLDSSGINVLFDTHRALAHENRRLALVNPSTMVRRILGVLSLEKLMPIFSTIDEALSYVRSDLGTMNNPGWSLIG
jgi:anti-anti-sigma factor